MINEVVKSELRNTYNALSGKSVEHILKCTKTERKRWEKEKRLKILYVRQIKLYGRIVNIPFYDRKRTLEITNEIINKWRDEHSLEVTINRHNAHVKANTNRRKNISLTNKQII